MKWPSEECLLDLNGQERLVAKFLYLPLTIGKETRWWEKVTIRYRANFYYGLHGDVCGGWERVEFVPLTEVVMH